MPELGDHIDAFLAYLASERGLSSHTIVAYRTDLTQFASVAMQRGARTAEDLLEMHVLAFVAQMSERGLSQNSIARRMGAVHSFAKYLVMDCVRPDDFMATVDGRKRAKRLPRPLSATKVEQLLDRTDPSDPRTLRDRALFELMYATGLRVSEVTGLRIIDLDLESGTVKCYGKGRKERMVPVGSVACEYVSLYLQQRKTVIACTESEQKGSSEGPMLLEAASTLLFPSRTGKQMDRAEVRLLLIKHAAAAGLTDKVSPHVMRHSFATHLLSNGADLRVVQELLGHAKVTTTEIYTQVSNDRLKDVYRNAHPRARRSV